MTEKKKRILIVDNDGRVSFMLRDVAETFYRDVVTTWSGIEALGLLKSIKFDVGFVDDVPDLHVGVFLDCIWRLRSRPQVVAVQTTPRRSILVIIRWRSPHSCKSQSVGRYG